MSGLLTDSFFALSWCDGDKVRAARQ